MRETKILGVDVGASGIKGAVVDIENGELLTERIRLETPSPSTPEAMAETFAELVKQHQWTGPIGCGFPTIIKHGIAMSAANIDKGWIGRNVEELFGQACGMPVSVLNDADAAGIAEMEFGAGKGKKGVVILITIGSGLGSALFVDGHLVPNSELGHVFFRGMPAEHYASNNARKRHDLTLEEWGNRFDEYLIHLNRLFTPDLFILGGGISKRFEEFVEFFTVDVEVVHAAFRNKAGALGAAYHAAQCLLSE